MSFLAVDSHLAQVQSPLDRNAHWITPEQQLNRLCLSLSEEVSRVTSLIPDIAQMVAQYTAGDEPATHWYKAHSRLKSLPAKVPPLPMDIHQILDSKCPIYGDQIQADGTYLKIKDTHFLSLIPKEFGSLNQLERNILKPYGEREYSGQENPLQFHYFWPPARQQHADVAFPDTHWVLMTKNALPRSSIKTWEERIALVDALSQKALANYEIPTLQQGFAAITTHMVATGERCYQVDNSQDGNLYSSMCVKETSKGCYLSVGHFTKKGVNVSIDYGSAHIGVAVFRKL